MRNLTRLLYGGLAAATGLALASYLYLNRGSNPPPKEPTPIALETQTPTPLPTYVSDTPTSGITPAATNTPIFTPTATATVTPTFTPTNTPIAAITPTPLIDWTIDPPVKVDCGTCFAGNPPPDTAEKDYVYYAGYYENIAREAYIKVADAFGMVPTNPDGSLIEFNIAIDNQRTRFGLNNGEDSYPYAIGGFRADSTLTHEMVHRFELYLLGQTGQWWWGEGLAQYVEKGPPNDLIKLIYDELQKGRVGLWEGENPNWQIKDAHVTGDLYFEGLIRKGLTPENNRIAIELLTQKRPSPYKTPQRWAMPQDINSSYERALGLKDGELNYLLTFLEPGIKFNKYI